MPVSPLYTSFYHQTAHVLKQAVPPIRELAVAVADPRQVVLAIWPWPYVYVHRSLPYVFVQSSLPYGPGHFIQMLCSWPYGPGHVFQLAHVMYTVPTTATAIYQYDS